MCRSRFRVLEPRYCQCLCCFQSVGGALRLWVIRAVYYRVYLSGGSGDCTGLLSCSHPRVHGTACYRVLPPLCQIFPIGVGRARSGSVSELVGQLLFPEFCYQVLIWVPKGLLQFRNTRTGLGSRVSYGSDTVGTKAVCFDGGGGPNSSRASGIGTTVIVKNVGGSPLKFVPNPDKVRYGIWSCDVSFTPPVYSPGLVIPSSGLLCTPSGCEDMGFFLCCTRCRSVGRSSFWFSAHFFHVSEYPTVIHPFGRPEYINFLKPILFMVHDSSSGF